MGLPCRAVVAVFRLWGAFCHKLSWRGVVALWERCGHSPVLKRLPGFVPEV